MKDERLFHIEQDVRDLEEDILECPQTPRKEISLRLLDIAEKLAALQNG